MSQDDVIVDRTVYPDYAQDEGKKIRLSRGNCIEVLVLVLAFEQRL
jgi:hypothetical protein